MSEPFKEFKEKLLQEKEEIELLLKELQEKSEALKEGPEITSEISESAEQYEEKDRAYSQEEFVRKRLEQIRLALTKMDQGTYGICIKCSQPIEETRLRINPSVETCRKCSTL